MNEKYQEDGLLGGKGFYIALMLCVSIIAVAAWMIVRDPVQEDADTQADVVTTPYQAQVDNVIDDPEPTVVIEQDEPVVEPVIEPVEEVEPVQQVTAPVEPEVTETVNLKDNVFVWPLVGETELAYSVDRLVYNVTMGDWRTHDGVDISASAGETVRACCSGLVEDVYDDDLYGTTVIINHGNGLMSYYASLQEVPAVKAGDQVLAGDIIGAVGTTAICESAEPPHLHFAMSVDGMSVDPAEYLPIL